MSATLPSIATLGRWLDAAVYQTDFRPVLLQVSVCVGAEVCDTDLVPRRTLPDLDLSSPSADQHKVSVAFVRP